jgi:uncharacterized RDD family membrane protein YckC
MGRHIPTPPRTRTISDTLTEAEADHLLDCPTADFMIRCAAGALDCIFLYLLLSSTQNFYEALLEYFPQSSVVVGAGPGWMARIFRAGPDILNYFASLTKIGFVYLYAFWSNARFGGSPGKLLLGLRILDAKTGQFLGLNRILLRELLARPLSFLIFGCGFSYMLLREDRRTLHDVLTGSVVKRVHENL